MDRFRDNFNRADSVDLGPNWTPINDGTARDMRITNNKVRVVAIATTSIEFYTGPQPFNDQYAQTKIATFTGTDSENGLGVRVQNTPAVWTGYFTLASNRGGGTTTELIKHVGAGGATIATENATTWVANDIISLQVIGTALRVYRNGVSLLTGTDTEIAAGTYGLWLLQDGGTADQNELDDFAGGDFTPDSYSQFPKCVIQQAVELGWLT